MVTRIKWCCRARVHDGPVQDPMPAHLSSGAKKMTKRILFCAILSLVACEAPAQQIDYKGFREWSWGKQDSTEYYLYSPSSTVGSKPLPIMLFLHGCCGEDYHATLRNAVDPPVRLWHAFGDNHQSNPIYIISPKTKAGWSQHFDNLKIVIDKLVAERKVDPQRIYISGFSMGARGTWEFIEAYPGYFAAAIVMGMDFTGKDPTNFKNIPVWAIRGDQDWWARNLGSQVRSIRALNITDADSAEWHTGVNPRLTDFEGMGHGVMWPAASQLDLKKWILEKVNDGNNYPSVIVRKPGWLQEFNQGDIVHISFDALDSDGKIEKVVIFANGKELFTTRAERTFRWVALKGDTKIEIKVTDDKGKSAVAEVIVRVDIPATINPLGLPVVRAGRYFQHRITGSGNGALRFSATGLPEGINLSGEGVLSGVPSKPGSFPCVIHVADENGDDAEVSLILDVDQKNVNDVILTNVRDYRGSVLPVSIVAQGISPHLRGDDEVTLSGDTGKYKNMLLIRTPLPDTAVASPYYLEFETDEDVTVYVAYEKLETLYRSGVPEWLNNFRKENGQLTTQYYYYDIYSKDFAKGKVLLPDGEVKKNGVNNNYFVMVRKKQKP